MNKKTKIKVLIIEILNSVAGITAILLFLFGLIVFIQTIGHFLRYKDWQSMSVLQRLPDASQISLASEWRELYAVLENVPSFIAIWFICFVLCVFAWFCFRTAQGIYRSVIIEQAKTDFKKFEALYQKADPRWESEEQAIDRTALCKEAMLLTDNWLSEAKDYIQGSKLTKKIASERVFMLRQIRTWQEHFKKNLLIPQLVDYSLLEMSDQIREETNELLEKYIYPPLREPKYWTFYLLSRRDLEVSRRERLISYILTGKRSHLSPWWNRDL